ncbi:MAG: F0F1 ATP synthase subunit gamma, partial [Candidatus Cloacimonetes bacterium]|nr:F0F1 ATP synthase subunit gamma [Candidatus Cloacimonadota bacterium]
MPNLKEIKQRIDSVTSTRQVTSAMKMVSAAKLQKAQQWI